MGHFLPGLKFARHRNARFSDTVKCEFKPAFREYQGRFRSELFSVQTDTQTNPSCTEKYPFDTMTVLVGYQRAPKREHSIRSMRAVA